MGNDKDTLLAVVTQLLRLSGRNACVSGFRTDCRHGWHERVDFSAEGVGLAFSSGFIAGNATYPFCEELYFFSYESNDALHLSEQERYVVVDCLNNIEAELHRSIDKHSKMLITSNSELLLNYCLRFYDRQFITPGRCQ